jgi:hypothetical protein
MYFKGLFHRQILMLQSSYEKLPQDCHQNKIKGYLNATEKFLSLILHLQRQRLPFEITGSMHKHVQFFSYFFFFTAFLITHTHSYRI